MLDEIINTFNERWFGGWGETTEEGRVKFMRTEKDVYAHHDFEPKVKNNPDVQNRDLALKKILDDVMIKHRKSDLESYKLYVNDDSFKQAFFDTMKRMVSNV